MSTVGTCACRFEHGRQHGYRRVDPARNLWGCGTCGRPTAAHLAAVVRRELAAAER